MVHKILLKKDEGIVLEDGEPVLLTKREWEKGRRRFLIRFEGDILKKELAKRR